MLAARKGVVGERRVQANKYVFFIANTVPQLHATFDGDPIARDHVVCDEAMRTNITVETDLGIWQHNGKLPDSRARVDVWGLNVGKTMDRSSHGCNGVTTSRIAL